METVGFTLKCPHCDSVRMHTHHHIKSGKYRKQIYRCSGCGGTTAKPVPIYANMEESYLATKIEVFSPVVSEVKRCTPAKRHSMLFSPADEAGEPCGTAEVLPQVLGYSPIVTTKVLATEVHPQASFWRLIAICTSEIWNWLRRLWE